MRNKKLLVASLVLFLLINTNYFWKYSLGLLMMPITFLLFIAFAVLVLVTVCQVLLKTKENPDKGRFTGVAVAAVVLLLIGWRPGGLIDFERMEGEDVLVATREGVANCTTTLKCKKGGKFYIQNICFGMDRIDGNYSIVEDTVFLEYANKKLLENNFEFGIRNKIGAGDTYARTLYLYKNAHDTHPLKLLVTSNGVK